MYARNPFVFTFYRDFQFPVSIRNFRLLRDKPGPCIPADIVQRDALLIVAYQLWVERNFIHKRHMVFQYPFARINDIPFIFVQHFNVTVKLKKYGFVFPNIRHSLDFIVWRLAYPSSEMPWGANPVTPQSNPRLFLVSEGVLENFVVVGHKEYVGLFKIF